MSFRNLLKEKEIKQAVLAKKLGVSQVLISKWTNGICEPQLETVLKLSNILNVSVEEIVNCFKKP